MQFAMQYNIVSEVTIMETENLPSYYTFLFNAVTDAIAAMDRQDFGQARALLVRGQQQAEDAYIGEAEAGQAPKGDAETTQVLRGGTDVIPA